MLFAGIDPGLSGGIVVINEKLTVVASTVMPVVTDCTKLSSGRTRRTQRLDEQSLRKWLDEHRPVLVTLEALQRGHPGLRGVNSALTMGVHHGLLRGLLCGLQVPYLLTPPKRWQAKMLVGSGDTKALSVTRSQQLFPTLDLTPGQRTKPHDGLADAALLALYGMKEYRDVEEG